MAHSKGMSSGKRISESFSNTPGTNEQIQEEAITVPFRLFLLFNLLCRHLKASLESFILQKGSGKGMQWRNGRVHAFKNGFKQGSSLVSTRICQG